MEAADISRDAEKLSLEDSHAVQELHHDFVKKLHPDLNPGLPEQAKALWDKIMQTYKNNDWQELYLLADMTDEFMSGTKQTIAHQDTLSALLAQED